MNKTRYFNRHDDSGIYKITNTNIIYYKSAKGLRSWIISSWCDYSAESVDNFFAAKGNRLREITEAEAFLLAL